MEIKNSKGILVVFGGFIIFLALGHFYTYANLHPYLVRYMENYTGNHTPRIDNGNAVWIFSLLAFGTGSSMALGGFIENKIGPQLTILISGWFFGSLVLLSYYAVKTNVIVMAFIYGYFPGIGIGICYGVTLNTPVTWFPNRRGLVTGLLMMAFGLSSIIFDLVQLRILNLLHLNVTHNETDKSIILENIPYTFLALGISYLVLVTFGGMFIQKKTDEISDSGNRLFSNLDDSVNVSFFIRSDSSKHSQFKSSEIFLEKDFWVLWFTFLINSAICILVIGIYKNYGIFLEIDEPFLTFIGIGGSFANCIGRVLWGYLHDKFPYKRLMLIITIATSIFLSSFISIYYIKTKLNKYVYLSFTIWYTILNFLIGGNFSLFPSVCGKLFGIKNSIQNYGILFSSASVGSIVTSTATTLIWQNQIVDKQEFSYIIAYSIGGGASLFAAIITLCYRGKSIMKNNFSLF